MSEKEIADNRYSVSTGKTILFGEDDIDDREILEEIFLSIDSSLRLLFINNGQKIIEYFEEIGENSLPCLIVLDYNMPGLNGAEILKALQNNDRIKNTPKVIWSTSDSPAYKTMSLELGARDYLVKPSKIEPLTNLLKHLLSYCDE